jgi:hypothetical protein
MPQHNKRKKQLAGVEDAMSKRRKPSKLSEESLEVPREDSLPINGFIDLADAISSLHGKKRTPEAEAATNTALPDVATSLPISIAIVIAEAATIAAFSDVVTSFPPTDLDVVDDDNANDRSVTDTQSKNIRPVYVNDCLGS